MASDRIQIHDCSNIGFWREKTELQLSSVEIGSDSSRTRNIPINIQFVTKKTSIMHSPSVQFSIEFLVSVAVSVHIIVCLFTLFCCP